MCDSEDCKKKIRELTEQNNKLDKQYFELQGENLKLQYEIESVKKSTDYMVSNRIILNTDYEYNNMLAIKESILFSIKLMEEKKKDILEQYANSLKLHTKNQGDYNRIMDRLINYICSYNINLKTIENMYNSNDDDFKDYKKQQEIKFRINCITNMILGYEYIIV